MIGATTSLGERVATQLTNGQSDATDYAIFAAIAIALVMMFKSSQKRSGNIGAFVFVAGMTAGLALIQMPEVSV